MSMAPGDLPPKDAVAVIFVSQRTEADEAGYERAGAAMAALAARQPGYLGMDSARGADGLGITVSYWADEASARAWRAHAEHAATRDVGRARWYDSYRMIATRVTRAYDWHRAAAPDTPD
ncbi:antibiotic biosynthesis monooxygenase family protein [Sphingobium lignivorans]|uniref:Heme-degrading monooxygenase HmoA n=1 Tax=Sphingobium lignivorans TaxID=2735886 RepID=A0ABR6NG48_9SPHN|nr:antibiotic biosynthesis monooxygenase [Sphingobium lignivorans]MBB5986260.1 heme-degrading monooxygenase HmoA [Sphingobium lignivorans]